MRNTLLDLYRNKGGEEQLDTRVSFAPFTTLLQKQAVAGNNVKASLCRLLLKKFGNEMSGQKEIYVEEFTVCAELCELMYSALSPLSTQEDNLMWGLGLPLKPVVFYGTEALYDLGLDENRSEDGGTAARTIAMDAEEVAEKVRKDAYALILERFYGFDDIHRQELVVPVLNAETGLNQYYKVHIDAQFVEVIPKNGLPQLDLVSILDRTKESMKITLLEQAIKLEDFIFSGVSIITLKDVTVEYTVESVKNALIDHTARNKAIYNEKILPALKTLVGDKDIHFGLIPLLKVNNKPVPFLEDNLSAVLFNADEQTRQMQFAFAAAYQKNPRIISISNLQEADPAQYPFVNILKPTGITFFSMYPIFHYDKLVGLSLVYTMNGKLVDSRVISKVSPVLPHIVQLLMVCKDDLEREIAGIIKHKYTPVQPCVQWRFEEAAWEHYKNKKLSLPSNETEAIRFSQVHPLYGAVDIRNSTLHRGEALRLDLQLQLSILLDVLQMIGQVYPSLALSLGGTIKEVAHWLDVVNQQRLHSGEESTLGHLLDNEINSFLHELKQHYPNLGDVVDTYFNAIHPHAGVAYKHRREMESSMQMINKRVSDYLEKENQHLQQLFPCYFEKMRTDGLEYDIYMGQSISPDHAFEQSHLESTYMWQLRSMADIVRITHSLLPAMPVALETTQLIFMHNHTIDISFRDDERRFDVEGAYNIRYQVIKKRIDKVHIKGTSERLTQPGKIAIVYFNNEEKMTGYIHHLQRMGILLDDLEYLELEELQGVSGLKALRVGVKL